MKRIRPLLISLLISAPFAAAAELPFGITPADIAAGSIDLSPGRAVSAARISVAEVDSAELYDVTITGALMRMVARKMLVAADGTMRVEDGRLISNTQGKGEISFGAAIADRSDQFELLMNGVEFCAPLVAAVQGKALIDLRFERLIISAPGYAMVGEGVLKETENVHIGDLSLRLSQAQHGTCLIPSNLTAVDMTVRSADGSMASVGTLEMGYIPDAGMPRSYAAALSIQALRLADPSQHDIATVNSISAEMRIPGEVFEDVLAAMTDKVPEDMTAFAVSILARDGSNFAVQVGNAQLRLFDFLGETNSARLGVVPGEQMILSSALNLSTEADKLAVNADIDASGFGASHVFLELAVSETSAAAAILAMAADRPPGSELLGHLKLGAFSLDMQDKGARTKIEGVTGKPMAAHVDKLAGLLSAAPTAIQDAISGWMRNTASTGKGSVRMRPPEPIGLIDIGMAAVMNPTGLAAMLQIEAD